MAFNRYSLKHVNKQRLFWQIDVNFCSTHGSLKVIDDLDCYINVIPTFKGQLISKRLVVILNSPKKQMKKN